MVLKMEFRENYTGNEISYYLNEGARSFGLSLSTGQTELFVRYYHLLVEANQKVNLTHITTPEDVAIKHFVDSLSCIGFEDFSGVENIVDVGTGAGFPGIPVKIFFPEVKLTLLDSIKKKTQFLKVVADTLSLTGVNVFHERAESFGRDPKYRESYNICFSRAVASLKVLVELCLPLVMVGGKFLAFKGPGIENEVDEAEEGIKILGGKVEGIKKFTLPFNGGGRSIVVVRKTGPTPQKFPRRAGIPAKRPL